MKNEAHMVILNATEAEQMLEQACRLFNLIGDLLHHRRVVLRPPTDGEPAKIVPLRRPRPHVMTLDEIF